MYWYKKKEPQVGDIREVDKFAWLPTQMTNNRCIVWLDWYTVKYEYKNKSYRTWDGIDIMWMVYPSWVEIKKYVINRRGRGLLD